MVGLPFEGLKLLGIGILSMLMWRNVRRFGESDFLTWFHVQKTMHKLEGVLLC
jgi:hypothetical protein